MQCKGKKLGFVTRPKTDHIKKGTSLLELFIIYFLFFIFF